MFLVPKRTTPRSFDYYSIYNNSWMSPSDLVSNDEAENRVHTDAQPTSVHQRQSKGLQRLATIPTLRQPWLLSSALLRSSVRMPALRPLLRPERLRALWCLTASIRLANAQARLRRRRSAAAKLGCTNESKISVSTDRAARRLRTGPSRLLRTDLRDGGNTQSWPTLEIGDRAYTTREVVGNGGADWASRRQNETSCALLVSSGAIKSATATCTRNDTNGLTDVAAAANGRSSVMANEWSRRGVETNSAMETDIPVGFNKAVVTPPLYPGASLTNLSRCRVVVSRSLVFRGAREVRGQGMLGDAERSGSRSTLKTNAIRIVLTNERNHSKAVADTYTYEIWARDAAWTAVVSGQSDIDTVSLAEMGESWGGVVSVRGGEERRRRRRLGCDGVRTHVVGLRCFLTPSPRTFMNLMRANSRPSSSVYAEKRILWSTTTTGQDLRGRGGEENVFTEAMSTSLGRTFAMQWRADGWYRVNRQSPLSDKQAEKNRQRHLRMRYELDGTGEHGRDGLGAASPMMIAERAREMSRRGEERRREGRKGMRRWASTTNLPTQPNHYSIQNIPVNSLNPPEFTIKADSVPVGRGFQLESETGVEEKVLSVSGCYLLRSTNRAWRVLGGTVKAVFPAASDVASDLGVSCIGDGASEFEMQNSTVLFTEAKEFNAGNFSDMKQRIGDGGDGEDIDPGTIGVSRLLRLLHLSLTVFQKRKADDAPTSLTITRTFRPLGAYFSTFQICAGNPGKECGHVSAAAHDITVNRSWFSTRAIMLEWPSLINREAGTRNYDENWKLTRETRLEWDTAKMMSRRTWKIGLRQEARRAWTEQLSTGKVYARWAMFHVSKRFTAGLLEACVIFKLAARLEFVARKFTQTHGDLKT
ncbi:hypothetical protein BDZ97DRAFT_1766195 [Flammula alnicola]|nr:hypothetical protein BDZ97DRAFT_1766195 [Flammula alnicola]